MSDLAAKEIGARPGIWMRLLHKQNVVYPNIHKKTLPFIFILFISIFIGFCIGSAPVISYHFGAQNNKELKKLLNSK